MLHKYNVCKYLRNGHTAIQYAPKVRYLLTFMGSNNETWINLLLASLKSAYPLNEGVQRIWETFWQFYDN